MEVVENTDESELRAEATGAEPTDMCVRVEDGVLVMQ